MVSYSEISKTWSEGFALYAVDIAKMYIKDKTIIIKGLSALSVVQCLNESYQVLVKDGSLVRIEDLPQEIKNEIWAIACTVSRDKRHRILASRSIHLLKKITEGFG